jgi:hypothetical protein
MFLPLQAVCHKHPRTLLAADVVPVSCDRSSVNGFVVVGLMKCEFQTCHDESEYNESYAEVEGPTNEL